MAPQNGTLDPPTSGRPLRVLIADASTRDTSRVVEQLCRDGWHPHATRVETADELRRAVQDERFELVLAEAALPTLPLAEALAILRDEGSEAPLLVVSREVDEESAVAALKAGAQDLVIKERLGRLGPAVERCLQAARRDPARSAAEDRLLQQSRRDEVTDVLNRRELERRLRRATLLHRTEGGRSTFCVLDLDRFRLVNEVCGRRAGDELLRQVARLLQEAVGDSDAVARLETDEFGLLLEGCDLVHASETGRAILETLRGVSFEWLEHRFDVRASLGLTTVSGTSESAQALLRQASLAMHTAKGRGGDQLVCFTDAELDLESHSSEIRSLGRLVDAIREQRFCLWVQRIVPVNGHAATPDRFEVLLRLRDREGRLVPPGVFIPAAESYDLMQAIDRWVIERVVGLLARDAIPAGQYMINVSGRSVSEAAFQDHVAERIGRRDVSPERLGFEITETAAIDHLSSAADFVVRLKRLGCSVALDDFGSGLSSFSHLRSLPVDYLKIDGSLVREMCRDPVSQAIVDAIHRVSFALGLITVAEAVEDDGILRAVEQLGIELAQGYAIHRPEPLGELG